MSLAEILFPVKRDLQQVEVYLSRWAESTSPAIRKMARAVFKKPGKLIRPGILLLAASHFGYKEKERITAAAAIEAIHTASLIHDDIIDGSSTRRGEKTIATVYGEKFSLLVGDFFFIRSITASVTAISPEITEYLTRATEKMIEGEAEELAHAFDFNLKEKTYWR
ncbi:MAG: polyprenyl synthetase family protein, partial [Candidatus Aminicenantes bacterium]|nr:polyprenyl synthetase family protein [Candidatus Aminicenantes bacterium]